MARYQSQLLRILTEQSLTSQVLKAPLDDLGLDDYTRFPFLALVGQQEMKLALLLALINRNVGGVLLIGPRGIGKTTAVRGLVSMMPVINRSLCNYGCTETLAETLGMDGLCQDCATKFGMGQPLTRKEPMRLIELPLNARLEDVVGGINERVAIEQQKILLNRGLLAIADQNLLYIDEVNMLDDDIINAILDAAAQGIYTVKRGPMSATYRSRLFLVGSMNPAEGELRPQIQDRFGLRVLVARLDNIDDRLLAYQRASQFRHHPQDMATEWQTATNQMTADIEQARQLLPDVGFAPGVEKQGLAWVQTLKIDSHRAEITMFEAARAYAAADGRTVATLEDLRIVAPMALRHRKSDFIETYMAQESRKTAAIMAVINQ